MLPGLGLVHFPRPRGPPSQHHLAQETDWGPSAQARLAAQDGGPRSGEPSPVKTMTRTVERERSRSAA
jgi:hypothetical protein